MLAHEFLKTEHEVLLFIDSDIEFTAEDVAKLWNLYIKDHDQDVSNIYMGAYRRKGETVTWVWKGGVERPLTDFTEPTEIDYAGTGFMMIPRKVFEALDDPDWERRDGIRAYFQDDGLDLSEDYFFCQEARKVGFKILCDPSIKLKHWGRKGY